MIVAGAVGLSACGELSSEEQARMDAQIGCLDRANTEFAILKDIPSSDQDEAVDDLNVDANGAFDWSVDIRSQSRPQTYRFICRGNTVRRRIESVEFDGVVKRPSNQEVWTYQ